MLHVFAVNTGQMMTFEVDLTMERVTDLKRAVADSSEIGPNKQVMLINGGQALDDNTKVYTYAAGTETNPIYVFDKAMIEGSYVSPKSNFRDNNDFSMEIHAALCLPPCYNTVVSRTQLALKIHEATRQQVASIQSLVHDEHLMFQGWQAAMANLSETVFGFEQRILTMNEQCSEMLQDLLNCEQLFEGLEDVIHTLEQIPLLPALLSGSRPVIAGSLSLRDWIEKQCHNIKLDDLLKECKQRFMQTNPDKLKQLLQNCHLVAEQVKSEKMRKITGINERMSALDSIIIAAKQQVIEQKGIAQGFVKNRDTARELQECAMNQDALLTLCESHKTQLQIMHNNGLDTRKAMLKCDSAKKELAKNLHTRLKWLYFGQKNILNADIKLSMFREQLMQLHQQTEFLSQIKSVPDIYFSLLTECVRRKSFQQMFTQWSEAVVTASRVARDREILKRKTFKTEIGANFIQKLFPGFSDKPPFIAKRPVRKFDQELPNVSDNDLKALTDSFPQFKSPDDEVDVLPDPSQLSWQLVYSTSTKATLRLQSSGGAGLTSQNMSVTSSINSTSICEESVHQLSEPLFTTMKPAVEYSPGGFVATSVRDVLNNEILDSGQHSLKNFSPPHLATPPPGDMLEIGSPESGEFFSVQPFHATSPKLQSFVSISPPHKSGFTSEMFSIPEDRLLKQSSGSSTFLKMPSQSQLTTSSTSDDEMYHSFSNEFEKDKVTVRLKELEMVKEELQKKIKQYEEEVANLQKSREEIISDFEKRLVDSREELNNIITQLDNEQKERKLAWNKEAEISKKFESLEEKSNTISEENKSLKNDLALKLQLVNDLDSEVKVHKHAFEMENADVREQAEREVWEMKQSYQAEVENLKKNLEILDKNNKFKDSELKSADNRIQELETQLSDTETKLHKLETAKQAMEQHKLAEKAAKEEVQVFQARVAEAESLVAKSEETSNNLKEILVKYEVQLEAMREHDNLLKKQTIELSLEKDKNEKLQNDLKSAEDDCLKLKAESKALRQSLVECEATIQEKSEALQKELNGQQENHAEEFDRLRTEFEVRLKQLADANKRKMDSVKEDHSHELIRIMDKHETEMKEIKKTNSEEQDELQADRLEAIVSAENMVEEYKLKMSQQEESHKDAVDKLTVDHQMEKQRLEKELEKILLQNTELSAKVNRFSINPSFGEAMMTSSAMSSSNEEMESKRTKVDDEMMMSYRAESKKEKLTMKTSFNRSDVEAMKRRQVLVTSALQQVTLEKNAEINRLKQLLDEQRASTSSIVSNDVTQSMTSSTSDKERDKIAIVNFKKGDLVLVTYHQQYRHYVVLSFGHTLHFLHTDSINELSLATNDTSQNPKVWVLAKFIEKEYCKARKATNRFHVEVDTKFYRVKVAAYK
ncbi:uncharacterized protein LOC143448435 isoform X1 [Clavelina lepadiformis]|uniref:uncharacterized protein LOC143448435 isoform X1 n=1 Tax=Clavelina lepadiformis TaxID=159417 RepID=UPI0040438CA2